MHAFRRILVPTDFGEAARYAEGLACDLADTFDASVTLLHVWTVPAPAYAENVVFPLAQIEAAARRALDREVQELRATCGRVKAILVPGVAWQVIVEAAKSDRYDLIIIGTHGRRGIPRLFLGSVAEKVVRASPVAVLTVRAPEEPESVSLPSSGRAP